MKNGYRKQSQKHLLSSSGARMSSGKIHSKIVAQSLEWSEEGQLRSRDRKKLQVPIQQITLFFHKSRCPKLQQSENEGHLEIQVEHFFWKMSFISRQFPVILVPERFFYVAQSPIMTPQLEQKRGQKALRRCDYLEAEIDDEKMNCRAERYQRHLHKNHQKLIMEALRSD